MGQKGSAVLWLAVALLFVVLLLGVYFAVFKSGAVQVNAELDKGRQREVSGSPLQEILDDNFIAGLSG